MGRYGRALSGAWNGDSRFDSCKRTDIGGNGNGWQVGEWSGAAIRVDTSDRRFPAWSDGKEYEAIYPAFNDFLASRAVTRVNGYVAGYGSCETLRKEFDELGLSIPRGKEAFGGYRVSSGCQEGKEHGRSMSGGLMLQEGDRHMTLNSPMARVLVACLLVLLAPVPEGAHAEGTECP